MSEYYFNVNCDKANGVFDTADEALKFATHHVWMSPNNIPLAKDLISEGSIYRYAYEFCGCEIIPVAKRRTP